MTNRNTGMGIAAGAVLLVVLTAASARSAETTADSQIVSVGLFKNGLAVVKRAVTIPAPGTYRINAALEPVYGTFWIESEAKVVTRMVERDSGVAKPLVDRWQFQQGLAGHEVTVYFKDATVPPTSGKVASVETPRKARAWSRNTSPVASQLLILETAEGRVYIDPSLIAYLKSDGATGGVQEPRPALLLTIDGMKQQPAAVSITYLTRGIAWSPSYRIDLSDPKTLTLQQSAVIKNELEDLNSADVDLITGFPNIEFGHVVSPLSLQTSWADFFAQLHAPPSAAINVMSQSAGGGFGGGGFGGLANASLGGGAAGGGGRKGTTGGLDVSTATGDGVDIYYHSIGKQTLGMGEALALTTASSSAPYQRLVEWIVPDTRRADGHAVDEEARKRDPEKYDEAAWDEVRFKNPLPFSMTTAPALIVAHGHIIGQRTIDFTPSGEQTTVRINKALSLRTSSVEHEDEGERTDVKIAYRQYRKATMKGELSVTNRRAEAVSLTIRRRFSGELVTADDSPARVLLEEGLVSANQRNELTWSVTLGAGEAKTLTYRYTVLVAP